MIMQTAKWSFNPGLVPTFVSLVMFPLLLSLGFWQLDRAAQKQAIFDEYVNRAGLEPVDWNKEVSKPLSGEAVLWRRAIVRGHYADGDVFLLDNQILKGSAGYLVYSPLRIEGTNIRVIINRGWVAGGEYRDKVPQIDRPTDLVTLTGLATDYPPSPGIIIGGDDQNLQMMAPGISRMQVISDSLLKKILGYPLLPNVIMLDASAPTGFIREWSQPGSGRETHLGYAFQWFTLAAALAVIYISVNLRRRASNENGYDQP